MPPHFHHRLREEDLVAKPRHPFRTFWRFFLLIKPHWHKMLLVVFLGLMCSPFPVLTAQLTKVLVDNILLNHAAQTEQRIIDFFLMILLIGTINHANIMIIGGWFMGGGFRNFFSNYMDIMIQMKLRKRVYYHLHRLPMSFFQRRPIGEHGYRTMADTGGGAIRLATGTVPDLIAIVNQTFLSVAYLAAMNAELALMVFIYVVPKIFFTHYLTTFMQRREFISRTKHQYIWAVLRETIAGAQTIKSFGQSKHIYRKYVNSVMGGMRAGNAVHWLRFTRDQIMLTLEIFFGVGLWAYVGWKTLQGEYTIGEFGAIIGIVRGIPAPLIHAVDMIQRIRMDLVLGERLLQTLDVEADNVDKPNPVRLRNLKGKIELRDVHFSYPDGTSVLRGVNLTIMPGQSLAIVGPSGQGKSTLLNLILRIYRVNKGSVLVDDVNINDACIGDIVKNSGVVLQDTHLFMGSIRENLKYPWPLAKEGEIVKATQIAEIHDFILTLPEGYDTNVREGSRMSGGQKQRLGIARALVGRPHLLFFDEPTSSLDTRTEMEVWTAMRNAMSGRTSLIVTHRLPTARTADQIAVLHNGIIAEIGTHDDLLDQNGIYAKMWSQQFHASEEAAG